MTRKVFSPAIGAIVIFVLLAATAIAANNIHPNTQALTRVQALKDLKEWQAGKTEAYVLNGLYTGRLSAIDHALNEQVYATLIRLDLLTPQGALTPTGTLAAATGKWLLTEDLNGHQRWNVPLATSRVMAEITRISVPASGEIMVVFSWKWCASDLGKALLLDRAPQSEVLRDAHVGHAVFRQYDDGWHLEGAPQFE